MKFIIVHGAFGSPEENWFPDLKERLESLNQEVIIPRFPVEDWDEFNALGPEKAKDKSQNLKNWLKAFELQVLSKIETNDKICMIGHSLGPLFILHAIEKYNLKLDCGIFVAPFMRDLGDKYWQFRLANRSFYKSEFDFKKLRKLIPVSYALYSENDPYVPSKEINFFAKKMNSSVIQVKKAGHLNANVNLNEFPLVLELCKSRLDISLYQEYIAHRKELYGVDYIKPSEEVIYLKPEEVLDEGIFKFRNLKKRGFCTLLTSLKMWDHQSLYMEECRRAATKTQNITRVFVIDNINDLKRKSLKQQLELDLASDVKIYFIMYKDIKDKVKISDFGIWDDEYLCAVLTDKVKLSSKKTDVKKGQQWEKFILSKAIRIKDIKKDVEKFVKDNS